MHLCQGVTHEEGQDTARISSPVKIGDIKDQLLGADIVVGLCTHLSDAVATECKQVARAGKIVLLCFIGEPPANAWAKVKTQIEQGIPGGSAWCLPSSDGEQFLGSYLTRLNRAARLLDAGQGRSGY